MFPTKQCIQKDSATLPPRVFPGLLPQGSSELVCQKADWSTFTPRVCPCLEEGMLFWEVWRSGLTHLAALPVGLRSFREVTVQHSPGFLTKALFSPSVPWAFASWCPKFHLAFEFAYTSRCLCLLHISLSFSFYFSI